jgi:hypothetical protein
MAREQKKAGRPGRKPPAGAKKQLLRSIDPEIIRRVKSASALVPDRRMPHWRTSAAS